MKILFVLESYHPNIGGVETLFKSLVEELAARNHEVMVLTDHPGGSIPGTEDNQNIHIRRYRFFNRYFFTFFAFLPVLAHAGKYDLIHTTSYNAGFPAFLGAILNQRKTIITFHEYWGKMWFDLPYFSRFTLWLHYLFEKFLIKIPFNKFIAVSEATRSSLISGGVSPERVETIYNGIDYSEWKPDASCKKEISGFNFIYFGRLGISKGLEILLQATKLLKRRRSDFLLTLLLPRKPKALFSKLCAFIEREHLKDHIQILHQLSKPELIRKVCSADAVVIPSYSEGFCYSAVESVALEKPIISSGRGALPEVVSGTYIELHDLDPRELSKSMLSAMEGRWSKKEVQYFHLKDTVESYIGLYEKILNH